MLETVDLPIADLSTFHRNPRRGDVDKIRDSLNRNGQYRAIVVNAGSFTGRPYEVLAGNHTLEAARLLGWSTITAHIVDVENDEAERIVLVDNKTSDSATYDDGALLALLEDVPDLDGTGWRVNEVESLRHLVESVDYDKDRAGEYDEGGKLPPRKRATALDVIFSCIPGPLAYMSYEFGWNPGIITSAAASARQYRERFPRGKPIMFMDNEWHDYDHGEHVRVLAEFRPKYGTVRDLVTEGQAEKFSVKHYTVEQTLGMAEDVAEHVDSVILIPKFDCLDRLPRTIGGKRVVLGYSVESSYGGTDMPPTRFRGWPVHLLGGAWKKQRAIMNLLGDDVVSIDNNNLLMISKFGSINLPDGSTRPIGDLLPWDGTILAGSGMYFSAVLSLAFIMHAIREDFGAEVAGSDAGDKFIETVAEEAKQHEH